MSAWMIGVSFLMFANVSFAQNCDKGLPTAKYDCARTGDDFAAVGDFQSAKRVWKISCETGLQSSCETVQRMDADLKKFKLEWQADPANQTGGATASLEKQSAKQRLRILKCKTESSETTKCLQEAKDLLSKSDSLAALEILRNLCAANKTEGCFALGGYYVRAGQESRSVQPYMTACSLGHEKSCSVLANVQAKMKLESDQQARAESRENERVAKAKKDQQAKVEAIGDTVVSAARLLSPESKGKSTHCRSTPRADGSYDMECVGDTPTN